MAAYAPANVETSFAIADVPPLMGWLWLLAIGAVTWIGLWRAGLARALWSFAGAALMLGGAGYAWQQRATLPGHPVRADAEPIEVDPGMVAFRQAIMPGAPGDDLILATADERMRRGDTGAAARGLVDAVSRAPGDATLWTALGNTLATHDGGQVSPAARFAFRRALQLAPRDPGPPFFLGLAHVQAGDLAAAKVAWLRSLLLTPRGSPLRTDLAERLAMLDQFQAMSARPAPPR